MDRELSEKLELLRFPLIVCVVFIHSQAGAVRFSDGSTVAGAGYVTQLIQATFSEILRGAAVPLFFLLSGFLFFQTFEPSFSSYLKKIGTRCRTLILPFLFWNTLILLFLFLVSQVQALSPFFTGGSWALPRGGVVDLLNALIGITRTPILYPFWFLRDLIVLVLLSPLIWYLAVRLPWTGFGVCLLGWAYQTSTPLPVLHHHAPLLFFYLGSFIAVRKIDPLQVSGLRTALLWLFLAVILLSVLLKVTEAPLNVRLWFEKFSALVTISTFWSVALLFRRQTARWLLFLSSLSFFVYATHEPTLIILTKLFFRFYPPYNDALYLAYYFGIPLVTVVFTLAIGVFLRAHCTGFYDIITGGRGPRGFGLQAQQTQPGSQAF